MIKFITTFSRILTTICCVLLVNGCSQTIESQEITTPSINKEIINQEIMEENIMYVKAGNKTFEATLVDNSSTQALKELLSKGPLTIDMQDYANMEKVGSIGQCLPTNDEPISTEAGDIILYQGHNLVIYYGNNSWNLTRIGKIENVTSEELLAVLGDGNISVTFSL